MYKLFLIILFSSSITTFILAQEVEEFNDTTKYKIQDVVVVGTRAEEKIIDIPYSVFRVDSKELAFGRKVSARDVLADVPGLFLQNRYGNSDIRVSLRGFGTRSSTGIRGIKILQDGIPESEPDGESVLDAIDFTSLGGVEVVKGNLSSLYANAPGGLINFITNIYFPKDYVGTANQFGKFGLRQTGLKFGLKNNDSRLFVSYKYRNIDGYRQHSSEYQHLVNTVYEAFVGTKSTLSIHANFVDGFNKLPGSLTKEEFESDPYMADPLAVSQDYRRITKKGRVAGKYITHLGNKQQYEFEFIGYGGIKELEKTDNDFYTLTTRYSLGGLARFTIKEPLFDHKNIFTVGTDYGFQSGPITQFDNFSGNRGISVQNEYNESLSNIGIYMLEHIGIVEDKLDLFLSSRFDNNVFNRNIYIPDRFLDTTRTMSGFSPKIGLNYKLTPNIALYSSYGLSFDYPALSEIANSPLSSNSSYTINPDLKPQESKNFEFGIKGNIVDKSSEFMRKLFFEVTYFNYLIKDEIVPFLSISQKNYFKNAPRTRRQGVEVGFMSEPFEEIELTINYTFTDFYYENYLTEIYTPGGTLAADYTNNKVPSIPKHIFNFILVKELELSEELSGLIIWDCDYIAEMYVNDSNSEQSPGYFYGNFMAGLTYSNDYLDLTGFFGINNIFDKRYASFININDYYNRYYETGEPRTFYFGMNFNYKI
ncbi:MAG: TonB-dependent receptor [Ignavibacteriota bacterium]